MVLIGIDPGTNTGFAVWDADVKRFSMIKTLKVHQAIMEVLRLRDYGMDIFIRIEDARMRKWFGDGSKKEIAAKAQGAGSVKRDSAIWEDFCKDLGIRHEMVAPGTFISGKDEVRFKMVTGVTAKLSDHARDAAMLVFNYRVNNLKK